MTAQAQAWFSALGEPLGEAELAEIAAYLRGLGMECVLHRVTSWRDAVEICRRPAQAWWNSEEAERSRLEQRASLEPADPAWMALNESLHGGAAHAAGASPEHPFLRKYALYCGGRWPLGVYEGTFAIF